VFFRLLLAFTLIPLAELALLLRLGEWLGLGATLALVIATGVAGAWLARREGLKAWQAVQRELAAGRLPGEQLVHALLVLVAGVVLVTPGVLTDLTGLLLMIPPVRKLLVRSVRTRLEGRLQVAVVDSATGRVVDRTGRPGSGSPDSNVDPAGGDPPRSRIIEI
jgi:UPF0716 protein FxsA